MAIILFEICMKYTRSRSFLTTTKRRKFQQHKFGNLLTWLFTPRYVPESGLMIKLDIIAITSSLSEKYKAIYENDHAPFQGNQEKRNQISHQDIPVWHVCISSIWIHNGSFKESEERAHYILLLEWHKVSLHGASGSIEFINRFT